MMSQAIDRLKRVINIIDLHYEKLVKIGNDLECIPVPDRPDTLPSPYSIIPALGGTLKSSLVHYSMDRNDSLASGDHLLELRIWRIANLVQILTIVLPAMDPLYDSTSEIHSAKYCHLYQPVIPQGWESQWDELIKTHSHNETAEAVARKMIQSSKKELEDIHAGLKADIGESTWDLR